MMCLQMKGHGRRIVCDSLYCGNGDWSGVHEPVLTRRMVRLQARRSWYMLFFQAPWLPEFLATTADVAFITGAFRTGAVAPRNKDAVSDDDIERCPPSHRTSCTVVRVIGLP